MFSNSPSIADIAAVTDGNRSNGWGDGNGWWVLVILFALFGWGGNRGFGGGYGNGAARSTAASPTASPSLPTSPPLSARWTPSATACATGSMPRPTA